MTSPRPALGKKALFAQQTSVTQNISAIADTTRELPPGSTNIPVDRVVPDPKNARRMLLNWDSPGEIDPNDPAFKRKTRELEKLRELAASIEATGGLLQPILVARRGDQFLLQIGHRRLMAHKLLGWKLIFATIAPTAKDTRAKQFIENAMRENLDLRDRLIAVEQVLEEKGAVAGDKFAAEVLQRCGLAQATAYRLLSVLRAPVILREAIEAEKITKLSVAAHIAGARDEEELLQRLNAELDGTSQGVAAEASAASQPAETPPPTSQEALAAARRNRGRPAQAVNLGKVTKPSVVKLIMARVLGDEMPSDIDWDDYASVKKAFAQMLQKLEKDVE